MDSELLLREIRHADLVLPGWFKTPSGVSTMGLTRGLLTMAPMKRLGAGQGGYDRLKRRPFFKDLCWEKVLGREIQSPLVPMSI